MSETTEVSDWFGRWEVDGYKIRLIEESSEWLAKRKEIAESTVIEPSQEEYMMELDYRLSIIELGL